MVEILNLEDCPAVEKKDYHKKLRNLVEITKEFFPGLEVQTRLLEGAKMIGIFKDKKPYLIVDTHNNHIRAEDAGKFYDAVKLAEKYEESGEKAFIVQKFYLEN